MIGQTIGHYRLEEELGRGGFGAVYRGVHVRLEDIQVAVKVFHPELSRDADFVRSLRRECQVLHSLSHPGIVGFRDLVLEQDETAIVLELLIGHHLGKVSTEQGPLPVPRVMALLQRILEPLAYGHVQGIVHRDVKPENVFLCKDGHVKLLDYGIAKVTQTTAATQSGMVAGTLDYMSAERFDGQSPPSADVYAAGLLAWGLLAGRRACPAGDMPSKIGWHLRTGAPDIRTVRPEIPAWLAQYLLALTAPDAQDRPADAGEALDLLESARAGTLPASAAPADIPLPSTQPPEPPPPTVATPLEMPPPRAPVTTPELNKPAAPRRATSPASPSHAPPRSRPEPQRASRPARPPQHPPEVVRRRQRFPWVTIVALIIALVTAGFIVDKLLHGG